MEEKLRKKKIIAIIGIILFSILIYLPKKENKVNEEVLLGDVNETMNYSFKVDWKDREYESNRPSSVTYNLYNVLDLETSLGTVTLTSANVDPNDSNTWIGTFNNVRKYNDDESRAKYIIKQQELSSYVQKYDVDDVDSLCVEFGSNVFGGDTTKSINLVGIIKRFRPYYSGSSEGSVGNEYYYLSNQRTNDTNFYYEDLSNKTICIYSTYGEKNIYFEGDEDITLDIKNVYPANRELNPYDSSNWIDYHDYFYLRNLEVKEEYTGKNYPTQLKGGNTRYTWDKSIDNYPGANIITNNYNKYNFKFDAYWEDEGNENLRPTSAEYYLYRKDNQNNVLKTITLTSANADPNDSYHWTGVFNDVDAYDQQGNRIEYVVRQKNVPNYINSYDSNEGYSIKFNEKALTGHYTALQLFFYDYKTDKWRQFNYEEYDGIGEIISGKTISVDFSKDYNFSNYEYNGGVPYDYDNPRLKEFETHQVEHFVGNNYPESHHPLAIYEYFTYEYRYSLSNHTQRMYLFYNGASWGGEYGIKIDSITTLGDETIVTSRVNLRDLEITKKWDDDGHTSERPSTTTIDIYNANDRNTIVKTITMSNSDQLNGNTWKKTITNLPKYDKNLQEIEYLIVERPISGYKVIYDFDEYYNALAVSFGENMDLYDIYIRYEVTNTNNEKEYRNVFCPGRDYCYTSNSTPSYGRDNITNRTIYVPKREFYIIIDTGYSNPETFRFNITDITLAHIDNYGEDFYDSGYNISGTLPMKPTTYEEYPVLDYALKPNRRYNFKYTWNGSTVPRKNANIIINKYDKTSFEFKKTWDDIGNEDSRPESIKYSIYNEKNPNIVVKTVTLTRSNENPNNRYEWLGTATGVPKYNSDGSLAKYVVKEEVLDKYKTDYDIEYNSICIKFGDGVFSNDDTKKLNIYVRNKDDLKNIYKLRNENAITGNDPGDFYRSDLQNKEICLPLVDDYNDFYLMSVYQEEVFGGYIFDNPYYYNETHTDLRNIDIENIYRKKTSNTYHYESTDDDNFISYLYYNTSIEFNNNTTDFTINEIDQNIHYTWLGDDFKGNQIITNHGNMREEGYIKEFNDTGYEYNRPKELVFGLYEANDPIPKEMVTVNTSTCINNKCNIDFKNVRDKDSDNNPITYTIREISDYGYDVTYENNKVINTANPVEIKLVKENTEGKILKGAKLGIFNKDGDKIKEIVTTDKEMTIKLLPSTYTIKEIEAPKDYSRCQDITLVVNKDGTYTQDGNTVDKVKIINEYAKDRYDITIKKTMVNSNNKEFTFEITLEDIEDSLDYTGSKSGTLELVDNKATIKLKANETIIIKNIPADTKYEIKEIENEYEITVKGDSKGTLNRNETIEFINTIKEEPVIIPDKPEEKDVPTPITGIVNYAKYILVSILLFNLLFLFIFRKKIFGKEIS